MRGNLNVILHAEIDCNKMSWWTLKTESFHDVTLSSLVALRNIITPTFGAVSDDKMGTIINLSFQLSTRRDPFY